MVIVANAIVDYEAVVVEAFYASATGHTVYWRRGHQSSAIEAEIVKVSPLFDGSVKNLTDFITFDTLLVSWLFFEYSNEKTKCQKKQA